MSMWSASAYTCRGPRETIRATRNIVGGEIDGDLHVEDGDGLAVESGDGVVLEGGRRRLLRRNIERRRSRRAMNLETGAAQRRDLRWELRRRRDDGRQNKHGSNGRRGQGHRGRHHVRGQGVVIGGGFKRGE
uniref:Uncharacterized protein n=1 Tax=Oryza rufipogon TaxID=4529 RepID=A0A0E0RA74_ORYRU